MKTEISRISFDERKHYLGVYEQMGRVRLDADANEQSEIALRLQQRHAADSIEEGSQNFGFRVGDRALIDILDDATPWSAEVPVGDPAATPYIDFFEHRAGQGSVNVIGATALLRRTAAPLDWSDIVELRFAAKCVSVPDLLLESNGTRVTVTPAQVGTVDGWRVFAADLSVALGALDKSAVDTYGFAALVAAEKYAFDLIEVDLPVWRRIVPWSSWTALTTTAQGATPAVAVEDDDRRWMNHTSLRVENAAVVAYASPAPRDLSHVRELRFAGRPISANASVTVRVIDANGAQDDFGPFALATADVWNDVRFAFTPATVDPAAIVAIEWRALDAQSYFFSPILASADPSDDLVIMGGDGTAEGAGRIYVDGLSAIKEVTDTYFTQSDLPLADPTSFDALAADTHRIDYAVLQVFERAVTYIEDPDLREIALEGPDTATRMKLVAQVRILQGEAVDIAVPAVAPDDAFAALPRIGGGLLTTKDNPAASLDPCADPCEPEVAGTFAGDSNQLVRVEIHRCGGVGDANDIGTALFKWSHENAAIASPLTERAAVGAFSAIVEQPERFAIGDLIELSDDLVDLMTGPYEDRVNHRCHERGAMRVITAINLTERRVSWEDAAGDPALHGPLAFALDLPYHPKIRRWSGLAPTVPGDIVLADAVVIEFGGDAMIPGDFWVFTTRVVNRSVERLIEAPAQGTRYRYLELARLYRRNDATGATLEVLDTRPSFRPLSKIRAADVAYDAEQWIDQPGWDKVGNVQEAIDALCRLHTQTDLEFHNKHLHGMGVVCGLKVVCHPSRESVVVRTGYALDCEGRDILVDEPITVDVLGPAQPFLDNTGAGQVALWIERSATGPIVHVEPHTKQSLWERVYEGSLLESFVNGCLMNIVQWFQNQLWPLVATTGLPVPETHKNFITLLHLLAQFLNPTSGAYVYLSRAEHQRLLALYAGLKNLLQSETFCAMFDDATAFPAYPWAEPPAQEKTMFGLLALHPFIEKHPTQPLLYAFGGSNVIHVFDTDTLEQTQELVFPGANNALVTGLAFAEDGGFFAVAVVDDKDSFFVRATLNADSTHTFGATTTVCDIVFTALATTPLRPGNLLALGRDKGLYDFANPAAIPQQPNPTIAFQASGRMVMSEDEARLAIYEYTGGTNASFDRIRIVALSTLTPVGAPILQNGQTFYDDMTFFENELYSTGAPYFGPNKSLWRYPIGGGAPATIQIPGSHTRLTAMLKNNCVLVMLGATNKVLRVFRAPFAVDTSFRIPVQLFPLDMTTDLDFTNVYVRNMLGTINVIPTATAFDPNGPPSYMFEPAPIDEMAEYRQDVIDAFAALLPKVWQYLKDCFASQFMVKCPECGPDDHVYLCAVEIEKGQVYNICNWEKRHYVKSFPTYSFWLSVLPIHKVIKELLKDFFCMILP